MIRLFVGLDLPEEIKEQIYSLRGGLEHALWRDPERMHLNLRFIGNVEEDQADEILRELKYIRFPAFHLTCKGLGYFDVAGVPHHLWVGVDNDKILEELHDKIDNALKKAGVAPQERFKFHPHVTIAKLQGTTMDELFKYISANNLFKTKSFFVENFTLFASIARENGEGKYYRHQEIYPLNLV